jgi:hypothetical protein
MLLEMNDDECEAQMHMNSAESPTAMDASLFTPSSNNHDFSCLHVQMCSIMLHDDEMINEKCLGLKNFGKKVREKIGEFC